MEAVVDDLSRVRLGCIIFAAVSLGLSLTPAVSAPLEPVSSLAAREKAPLLDTLRHLVSIESGSGDREGLDRIADLIAERLRALGGAVEMIEPDAADSASPTRNMVSP
jgi:glutamate carboxypeptidase